MENRYKISVATHLILIKNNSILLQRRFNTGYEDGNYSVIAGHINDDESIREAMVREAKEEAGIIINIDDLQFLHVSHRKTTSEKIDFFFTTSKWTGTPLIAEPNKADDLDWFELNDLPVNTVDYIKSALEYIKNKSSFSEFGWS